MKETKQNKGRKALVAQMVLLILIISSIIPAAAENEEKYGVLVIAHGSPSESWCSPVRDAVAEVDLPYSVELGFLEFVPDETINDAVERLDVCCEG